ncbi:hypothetical protein BB561_002881 [Smittium simulii]|uniref:Uncharacterized protein n=1 Tax=Smittium simulii TaxID=133385 RepID=A0A2T9YNW2_9FUNG|nr:hypothetical protein BB561_002881 [Smittium simulii]
MVMIYGNVYPFCVLEEQYQNCLNHCELKKSIECIDPRDYACLCSWSQAIARCYDQCSDDETKAALRIGAENTAALNCKNAEVFGPKPAIPAPSDVSIAPPTSPEQPPLPEYMGPSTPFLETKKTEELVDKKEILKGSNIATPITLGPLSSSNNASKLLGSNPTLNRTRLNGLNKDENFFESGANRTGNFTDEEMEVSSARGFNYNYVTESYSMCIYLIWVFTVLVANF